MKEQPTSKTKRAHFSESDEELYGVATGDQLYVIDG